MTDKLRNIAIIAHVDHGKTTLVDQLLQQSGTLDTRKAPAERVMDSNDQEKERGITILSKNTAIDWGDYHINIVDTPGHADFGGEVERVLSMVDSVLLLVDAVDGPMPQTRFVTQKAFAMGFKPIVVINKIDRDGARPDWVMDQTFDLFDNLGATDEQLDFPVVYASALNGFASLDEDVTEGDMTPLFQAIVDNVPPPPVSEGAFQMQVSTLDYNSYVGIIGIGRIKRGSVKPGTAVKIVDREGKPRSGKILQVLGFKGLERVEVADPGADRTLFFEYVLCPETESRRCDDPDDPVFRFASGTIDDPDTAAIEQLPCGTLEPSPALVPVFERAIEEDPFSGFGGLPVQVELRLRPDGVTDDDAEVASKRMLYTPQIIEEQTQNENPGVTLFTAVVGEPGSNDRPEADEAAPALDLRACSELGDEAPAIAIGPDTRVTFLPVEADGARQDYLVPTFDGDIRELTENLSYQWVSTGGDWVDEVTGGPVDPFGNDPPLRATWESPQAEDLEGPETIQFWSVVRDERGGQDWYRWCIRVEP